MRKVPNFQYEKSFWHSNLPCVVGIDEVGRGCLAGPVVAGAVLFSSTHKKIKEVNDSKKLTRKIREYLFDKICKSADCYGIAEASVQEINEIGIVKATFIAMQRALNALKDVDVVLVDGNLTPPLEHRKLAQVVPIVKGDQLSYSIASASILAKVYRDELMNTLHAKHIEYGWNKNVGYATAHHRNAIISNGMTPHHRLLFCRNVLSSK